MITRNRFYSLVALSMLILLNSPMGLFAQKAKKVNGNTQGVPVLWRDPVNIKSRNLFYGPGSSTLSPTAPFRFIKEDKAGGSPKFNVRDAKNVEWSVKLGPEAQPETVATRLVWAVGYFAEESYYFDRVAVRNLPSLSRGRDYIEGQNIVRGARFEPRRNNVKRGENWDWDENPFIGSRELNGLKVLMVLLNNFDARPKNNTVLISRDSRRGRLESRYVVTDIGATLGRTGGLGGGRSKNDLKDFRSAGFVEGVKDGRVEFDYRTRPRNLGLLTVLYPPYYMGQAKTERDMQDIPVKHARWIGSLLSRLSDNQLRDAFRAAGYDRATVEGYVRAIRERIDLLAEL